MAGSVLNIPLAYELEGRRLLAAAGRAWVVEEQYRGYAILLLDEFFSQPAVDLFLNTTVNQNAEQAYQTLDSPRVPKGQWAARPFGLPTTANLPRARLRARACQAACCYSIR